MTFSSVLRDIALNLVFLNVTDILVPKKSTHDKITKKIIQLNYAIRLHKQHDPNHASRVP